MAAPRSYRTAPGAERLVAEDGSRIELNTATALRTSILADSRDAWLDSGGAFSTSGMRRSVHAGPKTITVLGTRLSLRRDGGKVTVVVVSGRVPIDDAESSHRAARFSTIGAEDIAVASGTSMLVASDAQARVEALTAWRDRMAIFDQTPLADAAAELTVMPSRRS